MNILICGRLKQGKTIKAIALGHELSPGVVVWDPRHMVHGVIVQATSECTLAENLEFAIEDKRYLSGPIIVWPGSDLEGDFAEVCSVLFNPPNRYAGNGENEGGFVFVVDEASDLQKANSINDALRVAIKQHPRAVTIIQCTHSLQEWSRSSKDTMSHLYCFRLQGRSLTAVVEYCDVEDEDDLRDAIKSLPEHCYVHVDFEAIPGQPSWEVCQPLDVEVVRQIQAGKIPNNEELHHGERRSTERSRMESYSGIA